MLTSCGGCKKLQGFGVQNKWLICTMCMWISYCSKSCQEKKGERHKPVCAFIAKNFESLPMERKKFVKEELLKKFPEADCVKIEYLTEVLSKAFRKDEKAKINSEFCLREYGEHHEVTIKQKRSMSKHIEPSLMLKSSKRLTPSWKICLSLPFQSCKLLPLVNN